jgi:adenylate kinase
MSDPVIVLLGPPGSGKGTQAARLRERIGAVYVATGDLLRRHRAAGSELGRRAAAYMASGALVPDELVTAMVVDALGEAPHFAWLLDGFPRTVTQAQALDEACVGYGRTLDAVVFLDVEDDVIVSRLSGRLQCPTGHVYHVRDSPPARAGICDHDGESLAERDDDRPGTIRRRLRSYHQHTAPLTDLYRTRALLLRIDGTGPAAGVHETIWDVLCDAIPGSVRRHRP